MKALFWASVSLVGYTYLGYPCWLWLRSCVWCRPIASLPHRPSISIVLVARNEALTLEAKLRSLLAIEYPAEYSEIVVVSDGSTDGTNEILSRFTDVAGVRTIVQPESAGKAAGINEALKIVGGEIVVFTDARQKIAPDAILHLVENFADPSVGCASGELTLGDLVSGDVVRGMGLYWKIEKLIRKLESAAGSVVGATGALYAVRRSLFVPLPPEAILDDVYIPMQVVRKGARVVIDPRAQIWDQPDLGTRREFARKVRTLGGMYQLLKLEPWLLSTSNPVLFEFISHKLLRLAVPFALCAALVSAFFIPGVLYNVALGLQVSFYSLSACQLLPLGRNPLSRATDAAFTFVLLNAAAFVAFTNFVVGRKPAWSR